jgi:hypothetical protein
MIETVVERKRSAALAKFQIYYMGNGGGAGFLYGEDGDYGAVVNPGNARRWKTARECKLVAQDCAQRWRVPVERFHVFAAA